MPTVGAQIIWFHAVVLGWRTVWRLQPWMKVPQLPGWPRGKRRGHSSTSGSGTPGGVVSSTMQPLANNPVGRCRLNTSA